MKTPIIFLHLVNSCIWWRRKPPNCSVLNLE